MTKRRKRKKKIDMSELKERELAWEYVLNNALTPRERLFYDWAVNPMDKRKITVVGRSMGLTKTQSFYTVRKLVSAEVIDVNYILEKGRPYKPDVWENLDEFGKELKLRMYQQWVKYYQKVV